jgi:hypothetical protein
VYEPRQNLLVDGRSFVDLGGGDFLHLKYPQLALSQKSFQMRRELVACEVSEPTYLNP